MQPYIPVKTLVSIRESLLATNSKLPHYMDIKEVVSGTLTEVNEYELQELRTDAGF